MNEIYWISVLNNFCIIFCILIILGLIFIITSTIISFIDEDINIIRCKKINKIVAIIIIILSLLCVFIPSKKDLYLMYGIEYLKNNKLSDKAIEVLDKYLNKTDKENENRK